MEVWREEQFSRAIQNGETFCFYLYTPLCGTCHVASKMLGVVEELLPGLPMGKADLNYMPGTAEQFEVESVPCLLLFKDGRLLQKIYAFQSVPFLYDTLKHSF
ncbi:thioredoxin family protein [Peribacillus sp. SCS-37]|uniref:thioredoxin family protein n=1 Tax=Paraperibacillus esterisolvens TaxID=3115296 RepID=UPI003906134D